MAIIGADLGGTKLAVAVFSRSGTILEKNITGLQGRCGVEVGGLVISEIKKMLSSVNTGSEQVNGIGLSVPGIYRSKKGTVWAPNIPGWDDYPLRDEVSRAVQDMDIRVEVDSDRTCYMLGEAWVGAAAGCSNAVFLAIGTGIGAGVMCDGNVIRGHGDIAGAAGWMTLNPEYRKEYVDSGYFEYHASGAGLVNSVRELLANDKNYKGTLRDKKAGELSTSDIFEAFDQGDPLAEQVIHHAITCWGMAVANMVSLLNPEKIILGGGVFGPASRFLDRIKEEASKWAQPISMKQVSIEVTRLGGNAGLIGAGKLGLEGKAGPDEHHIP